MVSITRSITRTPTVQVRYDTNPKRRKDFRHANRIIDSPGLILTLIRIDS